MTHANFTYPCDIGVLHRNESSVCTLRNRAAWVSFDAGTRCSKALIPHFSLRQRRGPSELIVKETSWSGTTPFVFLLTLHEAQTPTQTGSQEARDRRSPHFSFRHCTSARAWRNAFYLELKARAVPSRRDKSAPKGRGKEKAPIARRMCHQRRNSSEDAFRAKL